jgi:hypothetical protein
MSRLTHGSARECEVNALATVCEENPVLISMLRAMGNWANCMQDLKDIINRAGDFVDGMAAKMQEFFNPQEDDKGNKDAVRGVGVALGVLGTLLGAISAVPQLSAVTTAIGVAGAVLPVFEREAT